MLIRSAGSVAQYLVAEKLEVHFSLQGRSRETRPVHLVHRRDDASSTTNRLVSGDLLHFESLKRSGNAVLSKGYGGDFLENLLSTYFVSPAGIYFGMSPCGRGGWHRACSVVPKRAGEHPRRACRRVDPIQELSAEWGAVRGVSGVTGANCKDFIGAPPVERELGLEDLGVRVRLRA